MTAFVVDSSIILAWLMDEIAPVKTHELLQSLAKGAAAEAPVLLRYEVSNVLVTAHTRRKRLSREEMFASLQDFENLPIRYDTDSPSHAALATASLAERHNLTVYDAAYLELALRKGRPLASLDTQMISAAAKIGVPVL